MSRGRRQSAIDSDSALSVSKQCELVSISRSSYYYQGKGESQQNVEFMRLIDEQFLKTPWYGSRQMTSHLRREGHTVNRKRIKRLMKEMGIQAVYQHPRTSIPHSEHKIFPYLLRGKVIDSPNQVWCSDITYIPMRRGFLYLVAIMDWYSRKVLAWRLSNSLDTRFCVEALEEALEKYGEPNIFNTDQGCQFTSLEFTGVLKNANIEISMDGKGRWMDNVFIERLWRSLKYECVYLQAFENGTECRNGIGVWISYYNSERPHSSFDGRTPYEVYYGLERKGLVA